MTLTSFTSLLFLQSETDTGSSALGAAMGGAFLLVWLAVLVVIVAALWKVFDKAGYPGWAAIIPIYNVYIMMKIAGKPGWWTVLLFIPFVGIIFAIIAALGIARNFGKGPGFGLGLAFLGIVFYPILAWGDARYQPQPSN